MINLNDNETTRDLNGMTLLVRSEVDEDDSTVSYDYCVVYGEKETDWITAGYVTEDEAFKQAQTWAGDIAESELEDTLQDASGKPPAVVLSEVAAMMTVKRIDNATGRQARMR